MQKNKQKLDSIYKFVESLDLEFEHACQVTKIALNIFDHLKQIHKRNENARLKLECAALLHDIGWIHGQKKHHKNSQKMIMQANLPFNEHEKKIIALIARYHRKALPRDKHKFYCELDSSDKKLVNQLAAILRLADGLDRSHCSVVDDIKCKYINDNIEFVIKSPSFADSELAAANKKSDLFELTYKKKVFLRLEKEN